MKFYNTFKRGDGSYRTTEFSAAEMLNVDILTFLVVGGLATILSCFVSGLLVLVTLHDFEDERAKPSIWGALISIYFLVDMANHWIMWIFMRLIYSVSGEAEYWVTWFTHMNISFLITHLALIILGGTIYFNGDTDSAKSRLVIVTIGICLVTFFILRNCFI